MAAKPVPLVAQCTVGLFELFHLLPCVDLALLDFVGAYLTVDGRAFCLHLILLLDELSLLPRLLISILLVFFRAHAQEFLLGFANVV